MKETGLIFKAPMVRAILEGRKTQTRRVAKPVKHPDFGNLYTPGALAIEPQHVIDRACPYGQPGDRIYVRETFGYGGDAYTPDIYFRASQQDAPIQGCWHPAIHMRKADARIWLEITSVRVERLQDISEADAKAEGAPLKNSPAAHLTSYRRGFQELWESTGGDWEANPWVWVIDFKRIEKSR